MIKNDRLSAVGFSYPEGVDFLGRLNWCAEVVGGKRQLAGLVGISEPQLYRYLRGEGEPSASKVIEMARVAQVDVGWLLTGIGRPEPEVRRQPVYDSTIYLETRKLIDEAWLRIDRDVSDIQRATLTDILNYERFRQYLRYGDAFPLTLNGVLFQLNFLLGFDEESLKLYRQFMIDDGKDAGLLESVWTADRLSPLVNALVRANTRLFNGPIGVAHYDRMGQTVWPQAANRLKHFVHVMQELNPKPNYRWIDLGCGNGREMSFIHRNFPHIQVHGIEAGELCLKLCQQQIDAGYLPEGAVQEGDIRYLKKPKEGYDVVYCRMVLDAFPYFSFNDSFGLMQVCKKMAEFVAEGGLLYIFTRAGVDREYGFFQQPCDNNLLKVIAKKLSLKVHSLQRVGPMHDDENYKYGPYSRYDDNIVAILQK